MLISQILERFLKIHIERPFLLGFSGGEDSSCLFHLLLGLKAPFAAVYIDHGWRRESKEEGFKLKTLCQSCQIPFHLEKIEYPGAIDNIEDYCRNERRKIFSSLVEQFGYQGVMLAHHAQDQAETVLKRIFEGASLLKFKGMEPVTVNEDLKIFRPLLEVSKEEIKAFLEEQHIPHFQDPTNEDTRFMRAKMRKDLFPFLKNTFGKNIEKPLVRIASESALLHDFLEKRTDPLFKKGQWGPLGFYIDLSDQTMHEAECRHMMCRISALCGITLSKSQLYEASLHLLLKSAGKTVEKEHKKLHFDRGRIFYLLNKPLTPGEILKGGLPGLKINFEDTSCPSSYKGWPSLWTAGAYVTLPPGEYTLKQMDQGESIGKANVGALWSKQKVPRVLCSVIPGIYRKNTLIFDPMTGFTA